LLFRSNPAIADCGQCSAAIGKDCAAMNILLTAGNTHVAIDRVRVITNIFTGRTGAGIALHAHERGHSITLVTSHPEVIGTLEPNPPGDERWSMLSYQTFDELRDQMCQLVRSGGFNAVIHTAAVSDYLSAGVYAPAPGTGFGADDAGGTWQGQAPRLVNRRAGKVKSDEPELWIRLTRAPKLIDLIRSDWGYRGVLVKFKLEVGVSDETLLDIAERSRVHSAADLMVANTLEGSGAYAFLGPLNGRYERVNRADLPAKVIDALERQVAQVG
jgi:phosphopantothenoylcysteine synthetase/decarboxylase